MKYTPHVYQQHCIDEIIEKPAVGLLLAMGLGKTSITLTAIDQLMYDYFEIDRVLVIAPKRVAQSTWVTEAVKWDHLQHLRISRILGSEKERIAGLANEADIYVTNRENVAWLVKYFAGYWPFDMVVVDELSSFKNHGAQRFKALKSQLPQIKRIVGLTGTPAPKGLLDLWAQVYLLDQGERLGRNITAYRNRYFTPSRMGPGHIVYEYEPKPGAKDEIEAKISDICISMRSEDYLELPDFVVNDIPIELSPAAQRKYDELKKNMILELGDDVIDGVSVSVLSNKLLQLCNGAIYSGDEEQKKVIEVHDCKLEALVETVEALNGDHALVFYNYRHDIPRILKAIGKMGLRIRQLENPEDEDAWNSGEVDILLAHPASCAHGLNLQDGGRHIIWFGLPWSLELYQQANKRLHRQGQKDTVFMHRLMVSGGLDEEVARALEEKGNVQAAILAALKAEIRHGSESEDRK